MLSKDDEDSLRAWANNHVVVGMVQARQTLALLEELERVRRLNEGLCERVAKQSELLSKRAERRPEQAVAGEATT